MGDRKHLRLVSVLALLCLLAPAAAALASTGDELIAGCEAMYRGAWSEAAACFRRAQASDNTCAEALVGQGAAALQQGNALRAHELFGRARVLDPEISAAYAGEGAVAYAEGNCHQAMLDYRRALTCAQARRARLRASAAYLACRLGLYQSARAEAERAVAQDARDPLARHSLAASLIAVGACGDAVAVLADDPGRELQPAAGVLVVPSALISPGSKYWADNKLSDDIRLAQALAGDAEAGRETATIGEATLLEPLEDSGSFFISRPAGGSTVTGTVELAVETDGSLPIRHIAVLLDNRFVAISNVQPFRAQVDTRHVKDGLRELRVEGYATNGRMVARAKVLVKVSNGARTLASEERRKRRLARQELTNLLTLRAAPLTNLQLLGRALLASGRSHEGIAACEYVFAQDPLLPGARADLLLGYREVGLTSLQRPREIHLPREPGSAALTFDDGPHPVMTPWILDLLDRYQVRATFFVVGKQAAMYPDLVCEIATRGHELGSHSHTHRDLSELSQRETEQELIKSRAAIRQACGKTVALFRPPGGNYDDQVRRAAAACGFTTVFWTDNIGNYPGAPGAEIAEAMTRKLARGGIVLLHNGYDETRDALPLLLAKLRNRGTRMGTISALAGRRGMGNGE